MKGLTCSALSVVLIFLLSLSTVSFAQSNLKLPAITGNHVFTAAQLTALSKGLNPRERAKRIQAFYRQQGYALANVVIAKKSLEVHEGYLNRVRVMNGSPRMKALLLAYGNKIQAEKPFRMQAVERYQTVINRGTGAKVRSVLVGAKNPIGTGELDWIV